jgi:formate hydrogenlyase subunit 4
MTWLGLLLAQLLQIGLVAVAAPTLAGARRWIEARLAGHAGASPLQPWRDLARLWRKQSVLAESASVVTGHAPAICAAATLLAACLVPTFTLGTALASLADVVLIAGLLVAARAAMALAAMDAGSAWGGVGASRSMLAACLIEPALLLVPFALGLAAGSLNLDAITAMQMESGTDWRIGTGLAFAAMILTGVVDLLPGRAMSVELSGRGLAVIEAADALRILVWLNLVGALFLPFGMARSGDGPLGWLMGLIAWGVRTLLLTAALALAHALPRRIGGVRGASMLGIAMLLGLLAVIFVLADMGAA